jgi:hypothetical protein
MIWHRPNSKICTANFFPVSYDLPAEKRREKTTGMEKRKFEPGKVAGSDKEQHIRIRSSC